MSKKKSAKKSAKKMAIERAREILRTDPTERDARVILASLTAPKGKGRAKLIQLAKQGDDSALAALEMSPKELRTALLREGLSTKVSIILHERGDLVGGLDREIKAAAARRDQRRSPVGRAHAVAKKRGVTSPRFWGWHDWDDETSGVWHEDPLKERAPGEVIKRRALEVFKASRSRARFRSDIVEYVSPGEEGVKDVTRRGEAETIRWRVSKDILKVPSKHEDGARWDGKYLWLSPSVRVRLQPTSREWLGQTLVVEKLVAGAWSPVGRDTRYW